MKEVQKRLEFEAKFLLRNPAKQVPKLLKFLKRERLKISGPLNRSHTDHYFDTPDWDLHQAGWSCRFRDGGPRRRSVELKSLSVPATGDGLRERHEVELPVEDLPDSGPLISAAPLAEELKCLATDSEAPLEQLFRVRTDRSTYRLTTDKAELLLCVDDTTVETDQEIDRSYPMRYNELELELRSGKQKHLRRLASRIREKFHLLPAQLSKFERGLQAAGLQPSNRDAPAREASLGPGTPTVQLAKFYLGKQFAAMLANEGKAIEGLHPEGVHQMRVASRRLRAGLRVFRDYLPGKVGKKRAKEIKWITELLGEVRDLDVFVEAVARDAAVARVELPKFNAHLTACRTSARRTLVKSLTSRRYRRLKRAFSAMLEAGFWNQDAECEGEHDPGALELAGSVLLPAMTELLDDGSVIDKSSRARHLHQLRLDSKWLRYSLELFAPVVPGGLTSFVKPAKELQKYLGEFQDACVALERIDDFRKSGKLHDGERDGLKQLRGIIRRRKRTLRRAYSKNWSAFFSRARHKRMRKLITTMEPGTAN